METKKVVIGMLALLFAGTSLFGYTTPNPNESKISSAKYELYCYQVDTLYEEKNHEDKPYEEEPDNQNALTYILIALTITIIAGGIILAQQKKKKDLQDDEDGDNPSDTPAPQIFGEEIEYDEEIPPVYIASDLHIGSNKGRKEKSNNMKSDRLKEFINWLRWVDGDVPEVYKKYHVIMNGDFLDMWQANFPERRNNNPMHDIMMTNKYKRGGEKTNFFDELASCLNDYPRMIFVYVIGNHDDQFITYDTTPNSALTSTEENKKNGYGQVFQNRMILKMKGDKPAERFSMVTSFQHEQLPLYAEHGHFHDDANYKKGDPRSGGQDVAEQVNRMQERFPKYFKYLEYVPDAEMVKYLNCLYMIPPHMIDNPKTPRRVKREIKRLKDIVLDKATTLGDKILLKIFSFLLITSADEEIEKELDPDNINEEELDEAKEIIDENKDEEEKNKRTKIVVFGHTHIWDLQGGSGWAYANSGSWLDKIKHNRDYFKGCQLKKDKSDCPFVRIYACNKGGNSTALVELISHSKKQKLADAIKVQL